MIASLATELGALTIAVITKPFKFEGKKRQLKPNEDWKPCATASIPSSRFPTTAC